MHLHHISRWLLPFLLLVLTSCNAEEPVFKVFKTVNVEVFPAVNGQITHNGKPLKQAKLKRAYIYADVMKKEAYDYAITDNEGRFSFPELTIESNHPSKPLATNTIAQAIVIDQDGYREYEDVYIWQAYSRGIKHIWYYQEMLGELNCELTDAEEAIEVYDTEFPEGAVYYTIYSICRWPERLAKEQKKANDLEQYGQLKKPDHYGDYYTLTTP